MWRVDEKPIQILMQLHDVSATTGLETRFNISHTFDGYVLTDWYAYNTTAGSAGAADSTGIELRDITAAVIIDTIYVLNGTTTRTNTGLSYTLVGGNEMALKVIRQTSTPSLGLRVELVQSDINAVR